MDGDAISDVSLRRALQDLRWINRWLGGLRASGTVLAPLFRNHDRLRVLDVGAGSGDYLAAFVQWGAATGTSVTAVGVDLDPTTVGFGRAWLDTALPSSHRRRTRIDVGDGRSLPYPDDAFDVAHAGMVLHHLYGAEAVGLLREMDRVSRHGLLVNDLHRHPLAYTGIWGLSRLLRMAPMVQHDAPLSVRRGFRADDLWALAREAGLSSPTLQWHWAFRWTLSTLP